MSDQTITTKDLAGLHVVDGKKGKRVGKVHHFIFHPRAKRVLGFTIKRPDAALMFKRKDAFVGLGKYRITDGQVVLSDELKAVDAASHRALDVAWDACVLWIDMPAMTEAGELLGYLSSVAFDAQTGAVQSVVLETGLAKDALLGKRVIPAKLVKGFRLGQGVALAPMGKYDGSDSEDAILGAIVVADEACDIVATGGAAEAAGKATAVVANKAKAEADKVRVAATQTVEQAKPVARKAVAKTGEAVNKGAYAAGKQLGKARGMFSAFKEEFDKALKEEEE